MNINVINMRGHKYDADVTRIVSGLVVPGRFSTSGSFTIETQWRTGGIQQVSSKDCDVQSFCSSMKKYECRRLKCFLNLPDDFSKKVFFYFKKGKVTRTAIQA